MVNVEIVLLEAGNVVVLRSVTLNIVEVVSVLAVLLTVVLAKDGDEVTFVTDSVVLLTMVNVEVVLFEAGNVVVLRSVTLNIVEVVSVLAVLLTVVFAKD